MKTAYDALQWLLSLGAAVLVPIILFLLVIAIGEKPGRAIRSALTVGVGFVGIFMLIDLFINKLTPATQAMVQRWSLPLTVIDVGWGPYMGAIWASPLALVFLPLFIVINFVLLFVRVTNTLDIDLWNYCLCFYAGALIYVSTKSMLLACVAFAASEVIALILADISSPKMQEFYGLPGISFPHVTSLAYLPIGYPLARLIDRIPFARRLEADPESLRRKFGVFGEPVLLGYVIGVAIGFLAGQPVSGTLSLGAHMAAVMVLLPRMVSLLVEGLTPLIEAIRDKFQKWLPGRNIYIGLDTAITIGHPSTIAAGTMLVPVSLVLASVLPWNRTIPFADLSSIPFALCLITPYVNGNVIKLFIIGIFIVAFVMLPISTLVAPQITQLTQDAGLYKIPEGMSANVAQVTSFLDGGNPLSFVIYKVLSLFAK